MNRNLSQSYPKCLLDDEKTYKKVLFNYKKNKEQDNTEIMDQLTSQFRYEDCNDQYWNPEKFSLLWGTPIWEQSSETQKRILNQMYWVAYYSQIVSAEIATIFFNQTSAAGLYGIEDFRIVCDTLDLESAQERAHINAFKKIGEATEEALFGERVFTYPMRGPYVETMLYRNAGRVPQFWRNLQLRAFTLLSSGNAFIGCQYFLVRGLRTLNGKLIQHQLSHYYSKSEAKDSMSIPSRISYHHFLDESFHFNSSLILSYDVLRCLKPPTRFEQFVVNRGVQGTQKDHSDFSTAINGLFWFDPKLFDNVYHILTSRHFAMSSSEALEFMEKSFTQENEGTLESYKSRNIAMESYKEYVSKIDHMDSTNRNMSIMAQNSLARHLKQNQVHFLKFKRSKAQLERPAHQAPVVLSGSPS